MRTFHQMLLIIVVFLSAAAFTTPADGQILQTIRDRATQARDRATEARNRATEARDHAQQVRNTIQEAVQTITGQIRTVIADSLEEATRIVNEELDGLQQFNNGGCPQFRQDLTSMLQNFEDLLNALTAMADLNSPPVSFVGEIGLIDVLPCRVLFPLYRAMIAIDALDAQLLNRMSEATSALWLLHPVITGEYDEGGRSAEQSWIDYEMNQFANEVIYNNATALNNATLAVTGLGVSSKIIGKILQSRGHTGLAAIKLQIHGYAGVSLRSDQKMKWGTMLVGLSDLLMAVSDAAGTKIRHAMVIGSIAEVRNNQLAILENQQLILDNQDEIMELIKTQKPGKGNKP